MPTFEFLSQQATMPTATTHPLANLADIHLPPAISAWPPAIGWWLLLLLGLAVLLAALWYGRQRRRRAYYRVEAKKIIQQIKQQWIQQQNPIHTTARTFRLLRRYFKLKQTDSNINRLQGQAWLDFVQRQFSYQTQLDAIFTELPYLKDLSHCERKQQEKIMRQVNTLLQQTELLINKNA